MFEKFFQKKNEANQNPNRIGRLQVINRVQNGGAGKKIAKKILYIFIGVLMIAGLWYGARANQVFEVISTKDSTLVEKILRLLPIDTSFILVLPVETNILEQPDTIDRRINILVLGMRGKDDPNGGLLADSSMVISIRSFDNKIALTSIPRDLFVTMPGVSGGRKLNEAYEIGEKQFPGKGLDYTKKIFSDITGQPIHYAVIVNFQAFKDLVDSLGGVELNLQKPFVETVPFEEGSINLPAGRQTIDGATALLYTRARMSSSDFDRSRRQQEVMQAIYAKLSKTGIILNPYRLNKIMGIVEKNIKIDMQVWEAAKLLKIFTELKNPEIKTKVIDNGADNILYSGYNNGGSYILLPTGENYDKIHEIVKNIFN